MSGCALDLGELALLYPSVGSIGTSAVSANFVDKDVLIESEARPSNGLLECSLGSRQAGRIPIVNCSQHISGFLQSYADVFL